MIPELIIALTLGVIAGTFTGLSPGIHINLVTAAIISSDFANLPEVPLVIFIISLSIAHTFIDFIPSIYLGAASEDTINSILPGHRFLLEGRGYQAVKFTLIGSVIAIFSLIIVLPIIYFIIITSYDTLNNMMGFILLLTIITLFYLEPKSKKRALIIFFLSGFLGIITLNSNIEQPLLPLLSGLFGSSTIIDSIFTKTKIPKQEIKKVKINKKQLIRPTILTLIVSPLCSFLPGLGASQAATITTGISKKQNTAQFLILLGSINTLLMTTSFFMLYLTNKTRSGAANAISQITQITPELLGLILLTIVISATISYPLALYIARVFSRNIHKVNYQKISLIILIILSIAIILITGIVGFLIYITATCLGLLTIKTNTTRSHLMAAILLPTTGYYLLI